MKNRFSTLQEVEITSLSANTKYNNFVKACKEASANVIPLKQNLKKRLSRETLNICQIHMSDRAYNSCISLASIHRIISSEIRLCLRANKINYVIINLMIKPDLNTIPISVVTL